MSCTSTYVKRLTTAKHSKGIAMTKLNTLVDDVYALFGSGKEPDPKDLDELGKAMATHISNAFKKREPKGELRASTLGTPCQRKLWYSVNKPEVAEDPQPWAKMKFLYGHLIEELALFLISEAGHKVERRQEEVDVGGIKGHLDAVVDGVVVDVKSANSRGMGKFYNNGLLDDDPFGYLTQINFYKEGLNDDPTVSEGGTVAFIAVDKELGHIVLDEYKANTEAILPKVEQAIAVTSSDDLPPRGYFSEPDGKSGNQMLCMECKYCPFKHECWPGLRTFKYANGPRYLTRVVKVPDVEEIKG